MILSIEETMQELLHLIRIKKNNMLYNMFY